MANNTSDDELERKLMTLFAKCTSFGFSFGHSTSKEEFAEMLSKGESLDHQEAAYEAMQLIKQREEQVAREARVDELSTTVFKPLQGRTWLDVRPDLELARISTRRDELEKQLTTTHKGDQ